MAFNTLEKQQAYSKRYALQNKEMLQLKKRQYYLEHKTEFKLYGSQRYANLKDKILDRQKEYYLKNKAQILSKTKQYQLKNRDLILLTKAKYRVEKKDLLCVKQKQYYLENKETIVKDYRLKNATKITEWKRVWCAKKYSSDTFFKLKSIIANCVNQSLKKRRSSKDGLSWQSLLGYSQKELKLHLEKQFDSKMSWANHGVYWDVDHVVPLSWFKTSEQLIRKGWALRNLQPLESSLNNKKRNFYVGNPKSNIGVIYL